MDIIKPDQLTTRIRAMAELPLLRQAALMVGIAASVAIGIAVVLWSQEPAYSPLYGNLSDGDAAAVLEALKQRGVDYKLDQGTGTVLVPAGRLHETRIALASAGLPKSGGVGFELLEEKSPFGESELMETARWQRVLEGELARTIASLSDVKGVRVHLALPKRSLFMRDQRKPSASVLMSLFPGRSLEPVQVQAIVHLVSSSVPDLERGRVTVIDQAGRLLTPDERSEELDLTHGQFSHARRLEADFSRRVEEILTPIVGPGRVRAQVVADMDFTVIESTEESYDPDPQALRSEQVSEQQTRGAAFAGGIPGALTNQPPLGGFVGEENEEGVPGQPSSTSRNAVRNYELDRTIRHVRSPSGVLKRLSVAVVVDDVVGVDEDGNPKTDPLSAVELEDLTGLVKKAVGFDEARGDSVHIVNASFQATGEDLLVEEPAFWEQPWFWELVKQAVGALIVVLLGMGILRPFLRGLAERPPARVTVAAGAEGAVAEDEQAELTARGGPPALAAPEGMSDDRIDVSAAGIAAGGSGAPGRGGASGMIGKLAAPQEYEEKVSRVQSMIDEDPRLAANLVKEWLAHDG